MHPPSSSFQQGLVHFPNERLCLLSPFYLACIVERLETRVCEFHFYPPYFHPNELEIAISLIGAELRPVHFCVPRPAEGGLVEGSRRPLRAQ